MPDRARTSFDRLTPAQQDGILALMSEPTVKLAAVKAGVNAHQIYRWLSQPDFNLAFREVRWAALRLAITSLAKSASVAATRLLLVAREGQYEKNQVEASKVILEYAFRGVELEELAGRIAQLEAAQAAVEDDPAMLTDEEAENERVTEAMEAADSPEVVGMSVSDRARNWEN
jgi:hypothetical protein